MKSTAPSRGFRVNRELESKALCHSLHLNIAAYRFLEAEVTGDRSAPRVELAD